jgi:hypothetical protein
MKLVISTVTLAATLLSFVAADVSKEELHHQRVRVHNVLSARKSHAFGRELVLSDECVANQKEVTNTGINDADLPNTNTAIIG